MYEIPGLLLRIKSYTMKKQNSVVNLQRIKKIDLQYKTQKQKSHTLKIEIEILNIC